MQINLWPSLVVKVFQGAAIP